MPQPANKTLDSSLSSDISPVSEIDLQPAPPPAINKPLPRRRWRWVSVVLLVIWLILLGWIINKRQSLYDWWRLRGYQPPASIVQLANQDTMNAYTRHLFYLNKPQLLPTVSSFRKNCPENPNTIVLGCYHPDQDGIFVYNVQDPTLAGVQQVTAAHEVLHSVYARLTPKARQQLDNELEDYYKHGLTDPRVKAEVKLYQQTEPHDVMDEMSCTFGTEIAKLPADLEAYYAKYFTNRAAIVAYEQQYEGEFTSRMTTINGDDQQLSSLKAKINAEQSSLDSQLSQINSSRSQLTAELNAGNTSAYNAGVAGFNSQVDTYNAGVNQLKSDIDAYNALVVKRNLIAGQLTTLDEALDTRLTTQSTTK